jgi:hypothetical protein
MVIPTAILSADSGARPGREAVVFERNWHGSSKVMDRGACQFTGPDSKACSWSGRLFNRKPALATMKAFAIDKRRALILSNRVARSSALTASRPPGFTAILPSQAVKTNSKPAGRRLTPRRSPARRQEQLPRNSSRPPRSFKRAGICR